MLDYGAEGRKAAEVVSSAAIIPRGGEKLTAAALLSLALRRKVFILAVAFACALAAFGVTKALTPRYIATAQIYLDPRGVPGIAAEANAQGQDSTGFINFVETQTRIITSQVVLERVVAAEKLTSDPEFATSGSLLGRLFGRGQSGTEADAITGAIRALGMRVQVRRPERTFIIDISATSNDPEKSARIANAVAQAYIDVRATMHSDAAKQAASSFTARLETLRERLLAAEKKVEEYRASHGFVGTRELYVDEQSLKELNQQLNYARTRLEDSRSRYEQVQRARHSEADIAAIAASMNLATLTALRGQQSEARQRLADLSADLGPLHPAVKNAAARVAETRRLLEAELARVAESVRKDYERARSVEEGLSRDVKQFEKKQMALGEASVKLRDLEREVDVSRSIYEAFLTRSRQTGEARQVDATSTHIITMASAPVSRSFPPGAALMMASGFVFGLGLGLALAFLRERPASLPDGGQTRLAAPAAKRPIESFAVTDATRFTVREPVGSQDIIELTRIGIPFVRPFADRRELDAVAFRLSELLAEQERPMVVGFIGDAPGAIRTIMAVNVALALRQQDLRVALVDADESYAALTVLVEDGVEALGDADSPYVPTRDSILLALPAIDGASTSADAVVSIIEELRDEPTKIDVVLCDGVATDERRLAQLDWLVPVLGRDQKQGELLAALPEAVRSKIALVLRFEHSDPWLARSEARKSA